MGKFWGIAQQIYKRAHWLLSLLSGCQLDAMYWQYTKPLILLGQRRQTLLAKAHRRSDPCDISNKVTIAEPQNAGIRHNAFQYLSPSKHHHHAWPYPENFVFKSQPISWIGSVYLSLSQCPTTLVNWELVCLSKIGTLVPFSIYVSHFKSPLGDRPSTTTYCTSCSPLRQTALVSSSRSSACTFTKIHSKSLWDTTKTTSIVLVTSQLCTCMQFSTSHVLGVNKSDGWNAVYINTSGLVPHQHIQSSSQAIRETAWSLCEFKLLIPQQSTHQISEFCLESVVKAIMSHVETLQSNTIVHSVKSPDCASIGDLQNGYCSHNFCWTSVIHAEPVATAASTTRKATCNLSSWKSHNHHVH